MERGKKKHVVNWKWCSLDKKLGGLRLKDLRLQGISLVAKWIFHALDSQVPWKILIRNNIQRVVPKHAKSWKALPFADIVASKFPVSVQGSLVFKSIWKAWELVRGSLMNTKFFSKDLIHGERSIWWTLLESSNPLALTRGFLARLWAQKGITCFMDILKEDGFISWEGISCKFNLPHSQKRTYRLL